MDTGKAIFFGLALIALAIFATDTMRPAQAGTPQVGRYMISGGDLWAWVIDTSSGRYRECDRDGKCSEWHSSQ